MNAISFAIVAICSINLVHSAMPLFGFDDFDDEGKWMEFKAKFAKTYDTPEQEDFRRNIFLETLKTIEEHNSKYKEGLVGHSLAINRFADMRPHEVPKGLAPVNSGDLKKLEVHQTPADAEIPEAVDWRAKGVVTDVKDQHGCGACWAFSATGALEGQLALKSKKLVSLSEQNLVDCDKNDGGCHGGTPWEAYKYVQDNGIDSEASYPYEAREDRCRFNKRNVVGKDLGTLRVKATEDDLKEAVATRGPVSVAIATPKSFQYYGKGIYKSPDCSSDPIYADHAVLVVGYGTENGQDYWLVKNSWGKWWGENGYIRMARNHNNICGIANSATYPRV